MAVTGGTKKQDHIDPDSLRRDADNDSDNDTYADENTDTKTNRTFNPDQGEVTMKFIKTLLAALMLLPVLVSGASYSLGASAFLLERETSPTLGADLNWNNNDQTTGSGGGFIFDNNEASHWIQIGPNAHTVYWFDSSDDRGTQLMIDEASGVLEHFNAGQSLNHRLFMDDANVRLGYNDASALNRNGLHFTSAGIEFLSQTGGVIKFTATSALQLPPGTTAQRPTPVNGMLRYNSTLAKFEGYEAGSWTNLIDGSPLGTKGDLFGFTTVDAAISVGANGQLLGADSTVAAGVSYKDDERVLNFPISGSGAVITTGRKVWAMVPWASTVTAWYITTEESGSIVIDVHSVTFASWAGGGSGTTITGSEIPTVTTSTSGSDEAITTWTDPLVAKSVLIAEVDSVTDITKATLTIVIKRND